MGDNWDRVTEMLQDIAFLLVLILLLLIPTENENSSYKIVFFFMGISGLVGTIIMKYHLRKQLNQENHGGIEN